MQKHELLDQAGMNPTIFKSAAGTSTFGRNATVQHERRTGAATACTVTKSIIKFGTATPSSKGVKITAASSARQTPIPYNIDLTVDDDMTDARDGTAKVLSDQERAALERQITISRQILNHLGPHSSTADQSYVARLTKLERRARERRPRSDAAMEVSNDSQQPPPPPPPQPPQAPTIVNSYNVQAIKKDTN